MSGLRVLLGPQAQGRGVWGGVGRRQLEGVAGTRDLQDSACAEGARQQLYSQGQAPAAHWQIAQWQIDVLIYG